MSSLHNFDQVLDVAKVLCEGLCVWPHETSFEEVSFLGGHTLKGTNLWSRVEWRNQFKMEFHSQVHIPINHKVNKFRDEMCTYSVYGSQPLSHSDQFGFKVVNVNVEFSVLRTAGLAVKSRSGLLKEEPFLPLQFSRVLKELELGNSFRLSSSSTGCVSRKPNLGGANVIVIKI